MARNRPIRGAIEKKPPISASSGGPDALRIEGLTKTFGGVTACTDINLSVRPNAIVGIIGPNGAGKSTLFDCITGVYRVDRGSTWLYDERLDGLRTDQTNRLGIARTFQNTRPFSTLTLTENVMVGALSHTRRTPIARSRAEELIEFVDLSHQSHRLGSELSTGQRKRLEMARALASDPRVLLMDEVTGGLDPGAIEGLLDLVMRIRKQGLTILVIEHNVEVIRRLSDHLIAMHLGQIIASGTPDSVVNDPKVVDAYMGRSNA